MTKSSNHETICPYLGWSDDEHTYSAFPALANACHRVNPAEPISKDHQAEYCLALTFTSCPVFGDSWVGPLPEKIRGSRDHRDKPKRIWLRSPLSWIGAILVLLILLVFAWITLKGIFNGPNNESVSSSTNGFTVTALPTSGFSFPTLMPLPVFPKTTPRPTRTIQTLFPPTSTLTDIPTPGPEFETPISPTLPFFIHKVRPDDTTYNLAITYNTRPEAIIRANGMSDASFLVVGQNLVIPVGITDPTDLPLFIVYQVSIEGETLTGIASHFGAVPSEIRFYNNLSENTYLPGGRWLIIPLLAYAPTPNPTSSTGIATPTNPSEISSPTFSTPSNTPTSTP